MAEEEDIDKIVERALPLFTDADKNNLLYLLDRYDRRDLFVKPGSYDYTYEPQYSGLNRDLDYLLGYLGSRT